MILAYIPAKYEICVIEDFIEKQDNRIGSVHNLLVNEWIQSAHSIIIEEVKNMDKDQAGAFFEATSALMSIQLRQLITDSILGYKNFFKSFDLEKLPDPDEMIQKVPGSWPNAFLKLRMVAQDGNVTFSDNYKNIVKEIKKVIFKIAEKSEKISRPDQKLIENARSPYL